MRLSSWLKRDNEPRNSCLEEELDKLIEEHWVSGAGGIKTCFVYVSPFGEHRLVPLRHQDIQSTIDLLKELQDAELN